MAHIVARGNGMWEIRESHATAAGPRSRTLATFRTLTPEIVERARARSSKPLTPDELRRAARRAGVPVAAAPPDRAAAELLAQLVAGREPRPALKRLLLKALGPENGEPTSNVEAAAAWIAATPQLRGHALHDLLLLVDSLPRGPIRKRKRFPRIESTAA